ncbi:hypothetical protein BBBOND_0306270 [Babesia bigemina]|uniref:Uncharacterized protein n=1 Tax=Babesia bigemina TaxID=5866 RepID=A0A061D863_BABBI|nr:hypothetical protein BBBOND_0306270 [Babesia bigemina]CDR96723.1 hypothetical protein BBBOND_0306270 [Babesia bigemina]|eukprot:XP_012768909.1 hypothetical protein BBBOND_0306270 [Babesia bigemina]
MTMTDHEKKILAPLCAILSLLVLAALTILVCKILNSNGIETIFDKMFRSKSTISYPANTTNNLS